MPNTTVTGPTKSRDRRKRWEASLLLWLTVLSFFYTAMLAATSVVYIRWNQGSVTFADGSSFWHEEAFARGMYIEEDLKLGALPPPARRATIEWIGFKRMPFAGNMWKGNARRVEGGHPLIMFPVIVLVLCAVAWLARLIAWRKNRRAGRCRSCGYSTVGLSSVICPECGAHFQTDAVTASQRSPSAAPLRTPSA